MLKYCTLCIVCLFGLFANAQVVKGIVADKANRPIAFATVEVQQFGKKKVIKATITDSTGNFEMQKIAPDSFELIISTTGFATYHSKIFVFDSAHAIVDFGKIVLMDESKNLQSVTVTNTKIYRNAA